MYANMKERISRRDGDALTSQNIVVDFKPNIGKLTSFLLA
jgi:hypothetical protein